LAIPFGFRLAGIIGGVVILFVIFALSYIGGLLLVRSRQRAFPLISQITYSDVAERAFGPGGRLSIDAMTVTLQIGTIIIYCVFILETLSNAFIRVDRGILAAALLAFLIPVLQLQRLDSIMIAAGAADLFAIVGLTACSLLLFTSRNGQAHVVWFGGAKTWVFIGIALFSVEGICLVLPVQSIMANPSDFGRVWLSTVIAVFLLYVAFGILGYTAFGGSTADIVLNNFAPSTAKRTTQVCAGKCALKPIKCV
jgi:solute carrier family 36 (proton-coupled amino acid transporter)